MNSTDAALTRPQFARPRLPLTTLLTWFACLVTLGPFLVYPVWRVLQGALVQDGHLSAALLLAPFNDPTTREAMRNSFQLGVITTVLSSLLAVPLAYITARLRFAGKALITGLLLVPLLLPPFVGAVGLRQMLGHEGPLNVLLMKLHLIAQPVDWLQMKAPMVALVAALHLYPLVYLNLAAAWANIDPALEEAAESQGAGAWRLWRTVTLPLLLPGYLSGALIVFVFAFVDLGTPLVFNYTHVAAVQIFNARASLNPIAYVIAFWMTVLAAAVFWVSRKYLDNGRIATLSRGTAGSRERDAHGLEAACARLFCCAVIFVALIPHLGVVLCSFARDWTSQLLPTWTTENYVRVFCDPTTGTKRAIEISIGCALCSMTIDVVAGFALAYALVRGRVWGRVFLDTLAMLPLALPGIILAFGLLIGYSGTALDPFRNPLPLLVVAYAVRRLPYALRAVSSGLQQTSVALEEASLNMGATPVQTLWRVTRPLVMANLLAAGLLTFAFAVLEVSDSLILAVGRHDMPIAKAIYQLAQAYGGGTFVACALGVIGMGLLSATFLAANRLLGKQLGALFRI